MTGTLLVFSVMAVGGALGYMIGVMITWMGGE